jgi:hypothetical protein
MADTRVSSLIVFAFGNREVNGELQPGPVNEDLARAVQNFVALHAVPVFAQWEVADVLNAAEPRSAVSITPDVDADGNVVYLNTVQVAEKAMRFAKEMGVSMGEVGVVAFADHSVRCVYTCRKFGLEAAVPDSMVLPDEYDADSGQRWTTGKTVYRAVDLMARAQVLGWPTGEKDPER